MDNRAQIKQSEINPVQGEEVQVGRIRLKAAASSVSNSEAKQAAQRLLQRRTQAGTLRDQINAQWDSATSAQKMDFVKTFMLGVIAVVEDVITVLVWLAVREVTRR